MTLALRCAAKEPPEVDIHGLRRAEIAVGPLD